MREPADRCIKAHLLRGVFWLLLLLATCVIPFVLGQRVIIERSPPKRTIAQPRPPTSPSGCGLAWHVVPSPNASANTNILFGVGENFDSIPLAVGTYYDENFTSRTLIERWFQGAWTQVSSPNPGITGNQLNAVAVSFLVAPWAVGFYTDNNFVAHTLVLRLGGTWDLVPSPDNGSNGSYLQGATAVATNDVWAVGYYLDDNLVNQTLVEHWDGQSWTIVPSPNRGADGSQLNGIAAVSPNDIWAAGYSGQGSAVLTLIEHWNGSAWTIVDSPNPGTGGNYLQATAKILTAADVWAVGYYYEGGHPHTLIERWDGMSWNVIPSANVGTIGSSLFGISGIYADNVWAVGAYSLNNQTGTLQTLIEHWDGASWNIVASPNQGTADNILYGITYGFGDEWSVGTYSDGINGRTLTVQYSDPCVTPTPTPDPPPFTPTPTPTATAGEACRVGGASCDDVSFPRTDFFVFVSCPVGSCSPGGFTVNGVPADFCTVTGSVSFHFNTSPVVPGFNTLHVGSGAISCGSQCFFRPVEEFTCTFQYFPPPPTPTPTPSSTPTPSPRPTPVPRPRPTSHPRP